MGEPLEQAQELFSAFEAELKALCDTVASNAPLGIRDSKRAMLALAAGQVVDPAEEIARLTGALNTADVREAMQAFKEKRTPQFRGE